MKNKIKRTLKIIINSILVTILIFHLILSNLASNSLYYAKNMPNNSKEKIMMTIVDHIRHLDYPSIPDYDFDFFKDKQYI